MAARVEDRADRGMNPEWQDLYEILNKRRHSGAERSEEPGTHDLASRVGSTAEY